MDAIGMQPLTPLKGARAADTVGDTRQVDFQRALQGLTGKLMQGQVMARLGDGSFIVRVAGTPARMLLPSGAQVGSEVPLTLVAVNPRPTFQVGTRDPGSSVTLTYAEAQNDNEAAPADAKSGQTAQAGTAQTGARATSLAATLLGKAPLTPSGQLAGFDNDAPAPELSKAGRAITSVLTQAQSVPGAPLAIIGKAPLVVPPVNTTQLAQTLHDTVERSGLFYESHVAEWAEGKRSLQSLMAEPQMQKALQGEMAKAMQGTDLASAQLINLQLLTHEQGRVVWHGEAWPGQRMEWEIDQDGQHGGQQEASDDGEQAAWRSGVRFRFPMLGEVSASVTLVGGRVHIQMQTATPDSAATLRQHAAALEKSLDAAGAPLSSLTISGQAAATEAGDVEPGQ
ncbi:flagellar hook-length control protein FliK [Janthinobacterium agaricidamnosum]|uniref:Flagellar hook-length control protein-like C-terminal domain-containing protein n=1 Tax=Janthinobacterium agaricidamnosum NBRC 102515 = DSM 9628 TaxID=1349767 RepID=W0UZA7_9BURK|nr:flagellar hook-length control protein FliK [Janthinobacterium agaricidamnosum]CDG81904.1 putative uncharacterized protein [Janthinobacterium agaricidamnosum NBRC 102515 = DSM 9628]